MIKIIFKLEIEPFVLQNIILKKPNIITVNFGVYRRAKAAPNNMVNKRELFF